MDRRGTHSKDGNDVHVELALKTLVHGLVNLLDRILFDGILGINLATSLFDVGLTVSASWGKGRTTGAVSGLVSIRDMLADMLWRHLDHIEHGGI